LGAGGVNFYQAPRLQINVNVKRKAGRYYNGKGNPYNFLLHTHCSLKRASSIATVTYFTLVNNNVQQKTRETEDF
jgi:hypothetical protein